jgi:enoyl-CoA hydratase/carnithine racemase
MTSPSVTRLDFETLFIEVEDGIATLTLNRPEKMNAFNGRMMTDLIAAFDHTDANDAVHAVIVTGEGKAFCAGADLSEGAKTFDYVARANEGDDGLNAADDIRRDSGGRVVLRIFSSLKPVIGAINGAGVGIGATMQLPMDVRLASTAARFGFVFARRGIVPEACSSWFLPRLVGVGRALEWCYSGKVFDAAEAHAAGLVRGIYPPEDLLSAARLMAKDMTSHSAPVSVALTRQMMWRMLGASHPMQAHIVDSAAIFERGRSDDAREGVVSFLEKRPAYFPLTVSKNMPPMFPWWDEQAFEWIGQD